MSRDHFSQSDQSEFKDFLTSGITSEKIIQKKCEERKLSDSANRKPKKKKTEPRTVKQRKIIQMLKELRTASDSNVSGCNPDSDRSKPLYRESRLPV